MAPCQRAGTFRVMDNALIALSLLSFAALLCAWIALPQGERTESAAAPVAQQPAPTAI